MLFQHFHRFPSLVYGLSERQDGTMKLRSQDAQLQKNRDIFFARQNIMLGQIISAGLAHTAHIVQVGKAQAGDTIPNTDGLLTGERDIFLSITAADCLPIFLFAPNISAVGLAHAGWRGLSQNIVAKAVKLMADVFLISANKILVGIGPGIGKCHFAIQADRAYELRQFGEFISNQKGRLFADLPAIAAQQAFASGVLHEHLEIIPECTFDSPQKYFSYRRDKPQEIQTMAAFIGCKS